jgi:hypothetical protein
MGLLTEITWMDITELIKAVAALGWPVLFIIIVLTFKNQVRALFRGRRFKSAKGFGLEVTVERELDALERATNALPLRRPRQRRFASDYLVGADVRYLNAPASRRDIAEDVLAEAGASPKAALLWLGSHLDRELRRLLVSGGGDSEEPQGAGNTSDWVSALRESRTVPPEILDSVVRFREVRNRIMHGGVADADDVLRAIDIGMRLLEALRALPELTGPADLRPGLKAE